MNILLLIGISLTSYSQVDSQPVDFLNDVMPVLSLGGCNQGPCHGALNGKGGFKLSLRGEDPAYDFQTLVKDAGGRRVSPAFSENSLLLQKATGQIPHEGGKRFPDNSLPYTILRTWISQGARMPATWRPEITRLEIIPKEKLLVGNENEFSLQILAWLNNGKFRDITSLAVFDSSNFSLKPGLNGNVVCDDFLEGTLSARFLGNQIPLRVIRIPEREKVFNFQSPKNPIDAAVYKKLKLLRIPPKEVCSDSLFLRRISLDLIGQLPTPDEVRVFLADKTESKREKWVDKLLAKPEFAQLWALKWSDLLRNEEKTLDSKGVRLFYDWIRRSFDEDKPLNQFAFDLLSARGSTYSNPAGNYYRALRDPDARAEAFAQVFMGVRIQCARCHNHPFDHWTQEDYHRLASFFSRIQYRVLENDKKDRLDKHEFIGEQIVWLARTGMTLDPKSKQPLLPRVPGGTAPIGGSSHDWLVELGDWLGQKENPYFASAQANRIWYHLMGRGIVEPIEDFCSTNLPSNPDLLDVISKRLTIHGYRIKPLIKEIVLSKTYQAQPPGPNEPDDYGNFAYSKVRPLRAEELVDGLASTLDSTVNYPGFPEARRAISVPGTGLKYSSGRRADSSMANFLQSFGKPSRSLTCECERSEDSTLGQAFHMISGPILHGLLVQPENRIGKLLSSNTPDPKFLEEFYLAALCRYPTEGEFKKVFAFLKTSDNKRQSWEDVVWGILNAKEFLLRQ